VNRVARIVATVAAIAVVVFGLACLNYTKADTITHHQEFASQHGLPPPSRGVFYGGVACVIVGSALSGYLLGSRNHP
jgi:hypothetical protein